MAGKFKNLLGLMVYLDAKTYGQLKEEAGRVMPEVLTWESAIVRTIIKKWLRDRGHKVGRAK